MRKSFVFIIGLLLATTNVQARDQISVVGSSTVYPFASYVAEELGAITHFKTPMIQSTGSGGGMKRFCAGDGLDTPDFTNASRRMTRSEFRACQEHGVKAITEVVVGYDGIVIAQSKRTPMMNLTRKELMLAVAAEVPDRTGKRLIANPYHYWDEINSRLPHRKIVIYGPPTTSGTRDAFEDMVLSHVTKHMPAYTDNYYTNRNKRYKQFHEIRQDGVYVPSGENDNLIVQKLSRYIDAIGIFGYSYLEENSDIVAAVKIEGAAPASETVENGSYPLSRSLYFYIKKSHVGAVPGMREYAALFVSDRMIGEKGECTEIGLIPLPDQLHDHYRKVVKRLPVLTMDDLARP